ncbi:NDP-hexose 2,3-dehydratase family protein [Streptomyces sp. CSDS2]|uniref:NDP-hexose 2,3-dehydratase family protein n=1 Tax=Streptomyces sp. CSDS2 TaxID=3055051 RepID=UPI0025AF2CCA|nr:NDP-hexose 2,3-dehydratase family protein [Streptomyces sp. CSDS2]MDN3265706.1 NDP-hexose 2,3-dehydratase family protein [Streptomyces sp. CSDS2]
MTTPPVHEVGADAVLAWLQERAHAHSFEVERVRLDRLDGWSFERPTGNLVHRSGKFFTVEGLSVATSDGEHAAAWHQPIIVQPEVGILGILVKEFDGVPHFLMQAKMEPGNRNLLQISPTVQATRSNYTKAHNGSPVRYLEYFRGPRRGRVLADVLQSEHGAWFHHKSNRNMLVQADGDVPGHEDFRWLSLDQIALLLRLDNVINMDARTVLSCLPFPPAGEGGGARHTDTELLSWFTEERSRHDLASRRVPLADLPGWTRGPWSVEHEEGRHFRVVGVDVRAGSREVARWSQPLFEPVGVGVTAFLVRRIGGVPHLLAHARVEAGYADTVEFAPTVQYTPDNYAHLPKDRRPPFLDAVLAAGPATVRYEALHSEEGGRFLNAESRYLFVEDDDLTPPDPPPGYLWVTPQQLGGLLRHNHYVNVQARTLLSCLTTGAVRL